MARAHAVVDGKVKDMTVLAKPKTGGPGSGYGAFSGGTPGGAVVATKVIQALTFTCRFPGLQGNAVTIEYTDTETAGAEVVTVDRYAISVGMEDGLSTAAMILAALQGNQDAMGLVSVVATGSGFQAAVAPTNLAGGANTPGGEGSGNYGSVKLTNANIGVSGARNNAAINVIARATGNIVS
jgi:hypothetical protein